MPEGVEVLLSTEMVRERVLGKHLNSISFPKTSRYYTSKPDGFQELKNLPPSREPPFVITEVKNHGKFMYWSFKNDWHMFVTFGMTGQWSPKEGDHVAAMISLTDLSTQQMSEIYFNDPRHFGTFKFVNGELALKQKLNELGWDPLQDSLDKYENWLLSQIGKSNKPIGSLLMDQKIFAGVGNYIRAEALYLAKISPWKISKTLSKEEMIGLCKSIIEVMEESYKYQGATIKTYKTVYGEHGKYSSNFKVYSRDIDPLGNKIITETTPEGRTIHWCPAVQISR